MKKYLYSAALLILAAGCASLSPQDRLTVNDKKINKIIAQMTLEEKVEMLHSKTNMSSEGVPRLGIQDIKYTDGPFGIREENGDGFRSLGWTLDSATYFPTGSALAATWSKEMAYKNGWAMGKEGRLRGKDIILGPAINIQRLPVGGRTYEYLSEDPVLSARLSVEYTKGSQDAGTAVCLKHYALNNQETDRGSVDVIADERTMREIYLKPFEAAIKEGGAMCVMPAYNKVNGFYCSENAHLNNEILRDEWGFKGMTVSDWGGTHSTMGAALGGLCVQMTGDNYFGQALIDSVRNGALDEAVVDEKVREILRLRFAIDPVPEDVANTIMTSQPETQKIAYEIAQKSIVLLKNEAGNLPISKDVKKIAVIGQNAVLSTAAGGIGAGVKTLYEISPLEGIQARAEKAGVEVVYAPGYKNYQMRMGWGRPSAGPVNPLVANSIDEPADPALLADAVALAKDADMVIFFGGTNKSIETEGSDRKNIDLPCGQNEVIKALYEANPNVATVLISGGPTDLRYLEPYSPAIVQGWWNGLEGGTALAEVLFGDIAPSGKLPFTFPLKLEDSPAYATGSFPGEGSGEDLFTLMYRLDATGYTREQIQEYIASLPDPVSEYREGILVGYRWYDTKDVPVMYAFGHGLSYVEFEYGTLTCKQKKGKIQVSFDLKNLGNMEADEVAQLYVKRLDSKVERAEKELEAFERVALKAGETKNVTLEFPLSELAHWDNETNGWVLEPGKIEILVGSASNDIRQSIHTEI
ncbi:MAG: glycoside hydrolase family 3 C-terminal domain-containing protein [Rikenellaceae bacterium]|nr:glycoside hydrolase family 3 C-terminal domain-containing protein [Rikenellaceae bacterium]MDY3894503.1 glycoside hydrolase family 3 C-terminal domain-containing protein [Candidatus Cryptobacteroides sp.]